MYNIGIWLLGATIHLYAIFNPKAKTWVRGRKNQFKSFPNLKDEYVVWFHCASLGEFDQGLPLMNRIKKEHPNTFLLVTFFSPSGMEHYSKRENPVDFATYLPLDTPSKAARFIDYTKPKIGFFVKYEFWCNHIIAAKNASTKLYNVSGLFRPKQRFFKWYGSFFRHALDQFNHIFVQNQNSLELLKSINVTNVTVTGDARFDRVIENKKQAKADKIIEEFKGSNELIIIGSSWPEDEKIMLNWINTTSHKIIIAPHDISSQRVESIQRSISRPIAKYSNWETGDGGNAEVLILDTIGHLASAYQYGNIAYVGGGFTGALHNILEPAVFGLPVLFGPKHNRFPEAQNFIEGGIGFSVSSSFEFEQNMQYIMKHKDVIKKKEVDFIAANAGASEKIYQTINL